MLRSALSALACALPAPVAEAHCDGPCGVYDPASARVAAEAVLSMTKKLKAMEAPAAGDAAALAAYNNTFGCLLYTSPSPRDGLLSRMPSSA